MSRDKIINILEVFLPNRATRRSMAGSRCGMCGLGIVAVDLALMEVELEGPPAKVECRPIHTACSALIWENLEQMRNGAGEEEPDAALTEGA